MDFMNPEDLFDVPELTPEERAHVEASTDLDRRLRALVAGQTVDVGGMGWIVVAPRRTNTVRCETYDARVYKAGTRHRKLYIVEETGDPGRVKVREVLRDGQNLALVPAAVGPLNVRDLR